MKKIKNSLQAMGALLALSLLATPVSGAPITFAFEAEITEVHVLKPSMFPLSVEVGEIIESTLTLGTPAIFASMDIEDISLSFRVDDHLLKVENVFGRTRSNEVLGPPEEEPLGPIDSIAIGCWEGGLNEYVPPCASGILPGETPLEWRPTLGMLTEGGTLGNDSNLGNPAAWNSFPGSHLTIRFSNLAGEEVAVITAVSGASFTAIPEPGSGAILAAGMLAFVSRRWQ